MIQTLIAFVAAAAISGAVGLGLQPASQPEKQLEQHPPGGHPVIPTPNAEWPKAAPEDVKSVDAIIAAFYDASAVEPKATINWDRFRSLFLPDARFVPARSNGKGAGAFYLNVTDYISANHKYFEKGGFMDKEVARRVEQFGNIAQVWSTFESRHSKADPNPYVRGINSIQLLKDGDRYWIVNVFWDFEKGDAPLPEKYLASPKE